jgi:hypothetical protein
MDKLVMKKNAAELVEFRIFLSGWRYRHPCSVKARWCPQIETLLAPSINNYRIDYIPGNSTDYDC